jgi:hypothetical protein
MSSAKRPPELQAIFDEIERAGPFASVEEINRLLAVRMREYNRNIGRAGKGSFCVVQAMFVASRIRPRGRLCESRAG